MSPAKKDDAGAKGPVIVISEPTDLAGLPGRVVTANDFLATDARWPSRETVINLCRSTKYLSKGYYVSLLADARGLKPLPAVETIRSLSNAHAVFRALQEADIPTVTPGAMQARRRALEAEAGASEAAPPQSLVVREIEDEIHVHHRAARPDEQREVLVCLGGTDDEGFRRLAQTVYRVWPAPILRMRLLREEDEWKVVHLSALAPHRLDEREKALLLRELRTPRRSAGTVPAPPKEKSISLAILYDDEDKFGPSTTETIEKLERTGSRLGVHVQRIGLTEMTNLGDYDALFVRTLTGLNEPAFRFATKAEALGMPVVDDTQSIIRCSNKVFLHELLKREGVPTPKTVVATGTMTFEELARTLGAPFIVKLPDGSFSTAVHKITTKADYRQHAKEMFRNSPLLVAQAYMPTDFDWRVTTLGGKVLFVCKYHMARGHWQIRQAGNAGVRYGKVEAIPRQYAPRDVVRVALKAAGLIGNGIYGVDVKETDQGPVVIEVNDNPNLDVGYDDGADGNAIYEDVIEYFQERVEAARRPAPARPVRKSTDVVLKAIRQPIGRPNRKIPKTGYRAYEVCGLELEYAVVDRDLNVAPLVQPILAALAGRPTSDVSLGAVGFSNEIVDHVMELKVPVPNRSLLHAEEWLSEAVRRTSALLQDHFDARLMPTGMHPWFDPQKARIWTRSNTRIYGTYERLFDVRTHGWANVHSCHVNLPVGLEHEATTMMNAAALLVPYLPALAASSPMYAGELQDAVDNRLAFILSHQERVPESTGQMVPEYINSLRQYRRTVIAPMYAAVDRLPDAQSLRHEFLNARGAVFKFSRQSMEIRVLDMQECVRMDVAIAAFIRAALKALAGRLEARTLALPEHTLLVEDFRDIVFRGSRASLHAPHLRGPQEEGPLSTKVALGRLVEMARETIRKDEEPYLDLLLPVIEHGSLSERIAAALLPHAADDDGFTDAARRVYVELTECLRANEPWSGRVPVAE